MARTLETLREGLPIIDRFEDLVNLSRWETFQEVGLITLGCGYGKTFNSFNLDADGLINLINIRRKQQVHPFQEHKDIKPEEVLFITPRASIKEENANDYADRCFKIQNMNDLIEFNIEAKGKISLACYQVIGAILRGNPHALDYYRLVIVDEYHMIFTDATFASESFEVRQWIQSNLGETIFIGLTATPLPYWNYMRQDGWADYLDSKPMTELEYEDRFKEQFNVPHRIVNRNFRNKDTAQNVYVLKGASMDTYEAMFQEKNEKMLVCLQSARQCYTRHYLDEEHTWTMCGKNNNKIYPPKNMSYAQLFDNDNFNTLLENKTVPFNVRKLYITSFLEVGFNIKDDSFRTIICESFLPHQIQQYRGRVRNDIDNLVIVAPTKFRIVDKDRTTQNHVVFTNQGTFDKSVNQVMKVVRAIEGMTEEAAQGYLMARWQEQQESIEDEYPLIPIVARYAGRYVIDWAIIEYYIYEEQCFMSAFYSADYDTREYNGRLLPNSKEFYRELLEPLSDSEPIFRTIKQEDMNQSKVDKFDWEPWLDKPLDTNARKELAAKLSLRDDKRVTYKTLNAKAIKYIEECGYTVTNKKIMGVRYIVIS